MAVPHGIDRSGAASGAGAPSSGDFIQAGNGAVTRTIQNKLRDIISIKDFGAVGDGVTDDTIAFTSALATGKAVDFPDGTYLLDTISSQTITDDIVIYGRGRDRSIIDFGGDQSLRTTKANAVVRLKDLQFKNGAIGLSGTSADSFAEVDIQGCKYTTFTRAAIKLETWTISKVTICDNDIESITSADNTAPTSAIYLGDEPVADVSDGRQKYLISHNRIKDITCTGASAIVTGICVLGVREAEITDNIVQNVHDVAFAGTGQGIHAKGHRVQVSRNIVLDCGYPAGSGALRFVGARSGSQFYAKGFLNFCTDNIIGWTSSQSITTRTGINSRMDDTVIARNFIYEPGNGIQNTEVQVVEGQFIRDNVIYSPNSTGIYDANGGDHHEISGNKIYGLTGTAVNLYGIFCAIDASQTGKTRVIENNFVHNASTANPSGGVCVLIQLAAGGALNFGYIKNNILARENIGDPVYGINATDTANIGYLAITGNDPYSALGEGVSSMIVFEGTPGADCRADALIVRDNPGFPDDGLTDDDAAVKLFDDFLGDVLADQWNTRVGSDAQCAAFAILPSQARGIIRGTTGDDAGASMALNGIQIDSDLNWAANQGGLSCKFRVSISAITSNALFVGFTDQIAALEMPFTLSGATLTSNASDAVGLLFDTAATAATWKLVGVANNVDATMQDSALAPSAGVLETWEVRLSTTGTATFFREGVMIGSVMTGAVTASVLLTPVIAGFSRAAASRTVDADFVRARMQRT